LRWFGTITQEEWPFLKDYLPRFSAVWNVIHNDPRFVVEIEHHELFYFYLTMKKPLSAQ
jgi:hypothetical protein